MRKIIVFLIPIVVLSTVFLGLYLAAAVLASGDVVSHATAPLNTPDMVVVSGTVTGPEGSVQGVEVLITSGSVQQQAITNINGFYSAEIPVTPQIIFKVRPPVASRLEQANHLVEGANIDFTQNFTLNPGSLLSVLPVGTNNEPITSTIKIQPLPLQEVRSTILWWYELDWDAASQRYQAVLPQDIVYVKVYQVPEGYFQTFVPFDLRSSDLTADIPLNTHIVPLLPAAPPDISKITFGPTDSLGEADVTGAPGAALPLMRIFINNVNSMHQAYTISEADGSFSARIYAPPGSNILIKNGPAGENWSGLSNGLPGGNVMLIPGTILYIPHTHTGQPGDLPFATAGAAQSHVDINPDTRDYVGAAWALEGVLHHLNGTTYQVTSTLRFYGPAILDSTELEDIHVVGNGASIYMQHNAGGEQQIYKNRFLSNVFSPSGFPIEMMKLTQIPLKDEVQLTNLRHSGEHSIEGDLNFTMVITDAPPGIYRPVITFPMFEFGMTGIPTDTTWLASNVSSYVGSSYEAILPPVTIGEVEQPRLAWHLMTNNWVQGQRGIGALEDRGKFGLVTEIVTQNDRYYVPPVDERTGEPILYHLEPFLPAITYADRMQPGPPIIPFQLPGGELHVSIQKPNGDVVHLGNEPFSQSLFQTPSTGSGTDHNRGTQQPDDFFSLKTASDNFAYVFDQYGLHIITMTGMIEDIWGNNYLGGGTYEVWVAHPLDIDPGVLPGTPLAVGDEFNPALQFYPRVPADVDIQIRYYDGWNPEPAAVRSVHGRANPFGYFSPGEASLVMESSGEYRVDLVASYTDGDGRLSMGVMTWGGVIMTPPDQAQLIAHGRRGYDVGENLLTWFVGKRDIMLPPDSVSHLHAPYHRGDIVWSRMEDGIYGDSLILNPSIQDTTGGIWYNLLWERALRMKFNEPMPANDLQTRFEQQEIPLFFSTLSGRAPQIEPENLDQIAYAYEYSQRPGIRVREYLGEDNVLAYWRTDTTYDDQFGVGVAGDIENDFKFQYMGIVFHDLPSGHSEYLGYGSSWVFLPDEDPLGSRVMPPFAGPGNGGWTTEGGPIMTLLGQDIHIFIFPTGVQPGAILNVGDTFRFAGHINPTLDSQVAVTVTAPSGVQYFGGGQANPIGYFYNPADNFLVEEPGLWSVDVKVWHDGLCSSGQTIPPYPQGDVLGSQNGRYWFYVVFDDAPRLNVTSPQQGFLHFDDEVKPVEITGHLPNGVSEMRVDYTIHMPGFILQQGQAVIQGNQYTFTFDPVALAQDFPNLDLTRRDASIPGLSDTISISIMLRGQKTIESVNRTNVITIQGQQVYVDSPPPEFSGRRLYLPVISR
jgi:hypothetical protein